MSNTYLTRNISAGDKRTGTFSFWLKRSANISNTQYFFNAFGPGGFNDNSGNTDWMGFFIDNNNRIGFTTWSGGIQLKTTAMHRDVAAWYHVVFRFDTTQSSDTSKLRMYINGQLITDFQDDDYPSQNHDFNCFGSNTATFQIGNSVSGTYASPSQNSQYFNGYIAQAIYAQGQSYEPTVFGSTNSDGVWVANASPSVTYGTNGFKLDFANSGTSADANGFGADSSGQGNHFASNNLHNNPNTTDSPQNNFCTINLLSQQPSNPATITEGACKAENTSTANTDNNQARVLGTVYPITGKWYMEIKYVSGYSATDGSVMVGLVSSNVGRATTYSYGFNKNNGNAPSHTVGYGNNGKIWYNGAEQTTGLTTFTTGDILGIAMDLTNGKFFVSKNGTFFSNGTGTQDPANGTNPLYSSTNIQNPSDGMTPGIQLYSNPNGVAQFNYGNPSFTIASGNADANGYGNFEYAVPSGFYAMCSKNLGQYG